MKLDEVAFEVAGVATAVLERFGVLVSLIAPPPLCCVEPAAELAIAGLAEAMMPAVVAAACKCSVEVALAEALWCSEAEVSEEEGAVRCVFVPMLSCLRLLSIL